MDVRKILRELERAPHDERVNHLVALGREARPKPDVAAAMATLAGGGLFERMLALPSEHAARAEGSRRGPRWIPPSTDRVRSATPARASARIHSAEARMRVAKWRRGGDSNPRYSCPYTGFRNQPIRPLWHLSAGESRWEGNATGGRGLRQGPRGGQRPAWNQGATS